VSLSSRRRVCLSPSLILILLPFLDESCFFGLFLGRFFFAGGAFGLGGGAFLGGGGVFFLGGGEGAFLVLGSDFLSLAANSKSSALTAASICFLRSFSEGALLGLGGGAFFLGGGGAFLPFGGGGGAFFLGGGGGGGGAFLPFGGVGGGGGGGFFAIPNTPCKQRVPLKKSGM